MSFHATAFATGAILWIAASRAGVSPRGGLSDYAARWDFNSVSYPALETLFARTDAPGAAKAAFSSWEGRPAWMQPAFAFFYAGFFARAAEAKALEGAAPGEPDGAVPRAGALCRAGRRVR